MTKNLVIDIVTDAKNFTKGFEEALQRIEKAGENVDILSSLQDDIDQVKVGLNEIQELTKDVDFDSLDTKHLDVAVDRLRESFKKLRQEFADIKLGVGLDEQVGQFQSALNEIRSGIKEVSGELTDLFTVSNGAKSGVAKYTDNQIADFKKRLDALRHYRSELRKAEDIPMSMGLRDSVVELEALNAQYRDAVRLYNKFFNLQQKNPGKYTQNLEDTRIRIGIISQEMVSLQDRIRQLSNGGDSVDTRNWINPEKLLQNISRAEDILDKTISNLKAKLQQVATADVTQFTVKEGKIQIPLDISTTVHSLSKKINGIMQELQGSIKDPIAIPVDIVSAVKGTRKKELSELADIKQMQGVVDSIQDPAAKAVAQTSLDQLKKRFAQALKIEITTNVEEAQGEIHTAIENIKQELKATKFEIKPQIKLTDEVKAQIKNFADSLLKALQDIQERMAHVIPKDANGEFIEDHTLLRFQYLIDLVESLEKSISHLDLSSIDLSGLKDLSNLDFSNLNFDKIDFSKIKLDIPENELSNLSQALGIVSEQLTQIITQFGMLGSGINGSGGVGNEELQAVLADLKKTKKALDLIKGHRLYEGLMMINDINGISGSIRDQSRKGAQAFKDTGLSFHQNLGIDLKTKLKLKDFIEAAIANMDSELEMAGYINTQTGEVSPFGYGWSDKSNKVGRVFHQYIHDNIDSRISPYNLGTVPLRYDMGVHTHPIKGRDLPSINPQKDYDLFWSPSDLRTMLREVEEGGVRKQAVISNGMAHVLDFTTLSNDQIKQIISRYNDWVENSFRNNLSLKAQYKKKNASGNSFVDYKRRGDIGFKQLDQIIADVLGVEAFDKENQRNALLQGVHYQGKLSELFKPMAGGVSEAEKYIDEMIAHLESLMNNTEATVETNGIDFLIDPDQLKTILVAIEQVQNSLNELQQTVKSFSDTDFLSGLNDGLTQFYNQWKKVSGVFDQNDINAQFEKLKADFAALSDESGKYNASKSKQQIDALMSEYKKYLDMGGQETISTITDNKESQKKLENKWKSYQKQLQAEMQLEVPAPDASKLVQPQKVVSSTIDASQLQSVLDSIQKVSNAIDKLQKSVSKPIDVKIFKDLSEGLNQFYTQWKKLNNIFDQNDINEQLQKIKAGFKEISDESGKYNGSKSKKQIEALMSEYKKYTDMGGLEPITAITDNKESQKKLAKKWESYQKQLQSEVKATPKTEVVDIADESGKLDPLLKKINEVQQAVEKKSQAFAKEQSIVEASVWGEVEFLEQLREEITAITDLVKQMGIDFKALSKLKFNKDKMFPQESGEAKTKEQKAADKKKNEALLESYKKELSLITQINKLKVQNIGAESGTREVNTSRIRELQLELELLRSIRTESKAEMDARIKALERTGQKQYNEKVTKQIGKFQDQYNALQQNAGNVTQSGLAEYNKQLNDLQDTLKQLSSLNGKIDIANEEDVAQMEKLTADAQKLVDSLKNPVFIKAESSDVEQVRQQIEKLLKAPISNDSRNALEQFKQQLEDINKIDLDNIKAQLQNIDTLPQSFSNKLYNKFRDIGAYFLSYVSIYDFIRVGREGIQIIHELDDALTEMAKVSNEPLSKLQEFQKESFNIANTVGTTAVTIQSSTADWMRLGESLEEAKKSAASASILFNVSEFESIDSATESLVAMSQAYSDMTKMDIIDKLNNIGNNYSISTDGLATALQNSASSLKTAGNDLDEAIALITAGNAVVQNPAKVGNAFRTVALRITGTKEAKQELADLGEDVDDFVVQTTAKSQKIIKDYTAVASNGFKGVDILDENGNFRSTYEILQDIADVYEEIVETDKQYGTNRSQGLLETLAGKNRANVIASVLQNPDLLRSVYQSSQMSQGSAEQELAKYKESISGHMAVLQNQWQEVWANTANREQINMFLDLGTGILELVNKVGLLQTAIPAIGAFYAIILSRGKEGKSTIQDLGGAFVKLWGKMRAAKATTESVDMLADAVDNFSGASEKAAKAGKSFIGGFSGFGVAVIGITAAIAAISFAIYKYREWYKNESLNFDAVSARTNEIIKASQDRVNALKGEADEYESNASSLQSLLDKYKEAEVNSEEYYNIRKEIASQYPELVVAWDSEGNAILQSNDKIQQAIDKYKELAQAKRDAATAASEFNIEVLTNEEFKSSIPKLREAAEKKKESNKKAIDKLLAERDRAMAENGINTWIEPRTATEWLNAIADPITGIYKTPVNRLDYIEELNKAIGNYTAENVSIDATVEDALNALRQDYIDITPDLSMYTQDTIDAVANTQQLATQLVLSADAYKDLVDIVKHEGGKGELSQAIQDMLYVDPSSIMMNEFDYSETMNNYLDTIIRTMEEHGIEYSDTELQKIRDSIQQRQQDIWNQATDLLNNEQYQHFAENVGIDLNELIVDAMSLEEFHGFDWDLLLNQQAWKNGEEKFGDYLSELKTMTYEEFSNLNFHDLMEKSLDDLTGVEAAAMKFANAIWSTVVDTEIDYVPVGDEFGGAITMQPAEVDKTLVRMDSVSGLLEYVQKYASILFKEGAGEEEQSWETFIDDTKESINTIGNASSTVSQALAEQNKYGFLSQKTFEGLTDTYNGFANAVTLGANGMQLNAEAAQNMIKTMKQDVSAKIAKERKDLYKQYDENAKSLKELTEQYKNLNGTEDAEIKTSLETQLVNATQTKQQIQDRIRELNNFNALLEASNSRYQQYLQRKEQGEETDPYDTMRSDYEGYKEAIKNKRWNDSDVLDFISVLMDKDLQPGDSKKFNKDAQKIMDTFFTEDDTGVKKFQSYVKDALSKYGLTEWMDEEGHISIPEEGKGMLAGILSSYFQESGFFSEAESTIGVEALEMLFGMGHITDRIHKTDNDFDKDLNKAERQIEQVQELRDSLVERGEIEVGDTTWQAMTDGISKAKDELEAYKYLQDQTLDDVTIKNTVDSINENEVLQEQGITVSYDTSTEFSSIDEAKQKIIELEQAKQALYEHDGPILSEENESTLQDITSLISHIQSQIQILTGESHIINIDTNQENQTVEVPQEFSQKVTDVEQHVNTVINAEVKNPDEINKTLEEVTEIEEEALTLGITVDTEDAKKALQEAAKEAENTKNATDSVNDISTDNAQSEMNALSEATRAVRVAAISAYSALNQINNFHVNGDLGFGAVQSVIRSARSAAISLLSVLNQIDGKNVVVHYSSTGSTKEGGGGSPYRGTAHLPTMSLWSGNSGLAAAHGQMGAKHSDPNSLVGELGPELRVRDNHWELLGEHGAEFRDVKAGDIIFNHKQTVELFKNGKINSRGRAMAGGSGGLSSLIRSSKYIIVPIKAEDWDDDDPGDGGGDPPKPKDDTPTKPTKKKHNKDNKGEKESKKAIDKFKEWLEKFFDWIEIRIDRLQDQISALIDAAEAFADRMQFSLAEDKYFEAIEAVMEQLDTQSQAAKKYADMADKVMEEAVKKKLIKSGDSADIMEKIKNGTIDISEYDKDMQEVIKSIQEWVDKSREAQSAIAELQEQVREYVKSLKELHDAQRDAALDRSKNFITVAQSAFESRSDFRSAYSQGRYQTENKQLKKQNKAYRKAREQAEKDVTKFGNTAKDKISTELDTAKGKEYRKALKAAQKCIDKKQPIPQDVLDTINENSSAIYARCLTYNQTLDNAEIAREEDALALAENINAMNENTAKYYEAEREAIENKKDYADKRLDNAVGAKAQNKLIKQQISLNADTLKEYDKEIKQFTKRQTEQANIITSKGNRATAGLKKNDPKLYAQIQKFVRGVEDNVKRNLPISANEMGLLAQYYEQGYITASFYQACLTYNEAIEHRREAEAQKRIAEETVKAENSANALQMVKNIQQSAENDRTIASQSRTKKGALTGRTVTGEAQYRLDRAAAQGHYGNKSNYSIQIKEENKNLSSLVKERADMLSSLNNSLKAGIIEEGSEDYVAALEAINGVSDAIASARNNILELNKSMRQIDWSIFDDGMARAKRLNSEISHFVNMLANQELFRDDKKGNITRYGEALLDLRNTEYKANLQEAQQYLNQYNSLIDQINKKKLDPTDSDVIARLDSLQDSYWSSMEAAEGAKQAIIDLVRQGYESQLAALNKTIAKYKELKNEEKAAYDYQKQISDKAKNITNLEKQLAAYRGNTSEEAVSKIQKLQSDLKNAREDLRDAEYSKYLSDAQSMLDNLSTQFQDWIDQRMKQRDDILADIQRTLAGKMDMLGTESVNRKIDNTVLTLKEMDSSITTTLKTALGSNGSLKGVISGAIKEAQTNYKTQTAQEKATEIESQLTAYRGKKITSITKDDAKEISRIADEYSNLDKDEQALVSKDDRNLLKSLKARIKYLNNSEKYESQIKSSQNKINSYEAQIRSGEARIQSLQSELARAAGTEKSRINAEINKLRDSVSGWRASLTAEKKTLNDLKKAYDDLKKNPGYASGIRNVPNDQLAWTQEKGQELIYRKSDGAILTPLSQGDKVFTASMSENLWKIAQMNIADMFDKSMTQPVVSYNTVNNNVAPNTTIQMSITLPNVTNYNEFKTALIADRNFQNAVQDMTLGAAMGKNSLSKYRYN